MQVPGFVYSEYNVGDSIAAYTTDHVSYSYYKYGILPDTEYTNNELMKSGLAYCLELEYFYWLCLGY